VGVENIWLQRETRSGCAPKPDAPRMKYGRNNHMNRPVHGDVKGLG